MVQQQCHQLALRRQRDGQLVEFVRVHSPTVRVLKLLRGEIDMTQGSLPSELVTWLEGRAQIADDGSAGVALAWLAGAL